MILSKGLMGRALAFISPILAAVIVVLLLTLAFPRETHAAFGMCDAKCTASRCVPGGDPKKDPPCPSITCTDTTNTGVTTCHCVSSKPGKCVGDGFNTPGGDMKGIGDIGKFLEQAMGMAQKLMEMAKKGGGGGGGGGGQTPQTGPLYPACVRNAATNTVSPIPCTETNGAINYGTSGTGGTTGTISGSASDILLGALSGGSSAASSTNTNTNTSSTTITITGGQIGTTETSPSVIIQGAQSGVQPSAQLSQQQGMLQGDIVVGGTGGMLYVRSRDPQNNTEVAGFFGGNTVGQQQSSSLIGNMCGTRPWSGGLLGGFISPSFFDSLCQRFGYQVGVIPVTNSGTVNTVVPKQPSITITQQPVTPTTVTPSVALQPEADIWANPASVRLGSRTYIFWNTRNVASCTVSGPSFSHNTLSGGASTVPLSDTSTYTLECKTADGQTMRDSVRVNLAL